MTWLAPKIFQGHVGGIVRIFDSIRIRFEKSRIEYESNFFLVESIRFDADSIRFGLCGTLVGMCCGFWTCPAMVLCIGM